MTLGIVILWICGSGQNSKPILKKRNQNPTASWGYPSKTSSAITPRVLYSTYALIDTLIDTLIDSLIDTPKILPN